MYKNLNEMLTSDADQSFPSREISHMLQNQQKPKIKNQIHNAEKKQNW